MTKAEYNQSGVERIEKIKAQKNCNKTQAVKFLKETTPLEKDVQKKIIADLKKAHPDAFFHKVTLMQYSEAGLPDLLMIKNGHYFGFEIKRPAPLGTVTDLQEKTMERIRAAGGTAEVITSADEANEIIKKYLK